MPSLNKLLRAGERRHLRVLEALAERVSAAAPHTEKLSDAELAARYAKLREEVADGMQATAPSVAVPAMALAREAAARALGMRPYDVQVLGALAMTRGSVAEMRTGEGKTLTATLAAAVFALAGRGVHVVTVNEYLAARDAEWMAPAFEKLGLTVGVSASEQTHEQKRAAYEADITYVTHTELGFDFLRDNLATDVREQVGVGSAFALVDEADNVLIDDARTPLIISDVSDAAADYSRFAELAKRLQRGERPESAGGLTILASRREAAQFVADYDYEVDERDQVVAVTERGVAAAEAFLGVENLYAAEHGHLVSMLQNAVKAKELFLRDRDYAVIDGAVEIIDESTGRILGGRRWSDGLHQAVEAKEGVPVLPEQHTVASVTYQNLFRRYDVLCGMTGTALTDARELQAVYGLDVVVVPTHRPVARVDHPDRLYADKPAKWRAVVADVCERHAAGQPVLVGTRSVEDSELLSAMMTAEGVAHQVLNAKPERVAQESRIIAAAGRPGAVTIATNMAGRGVDIKLGGDVSAVAKDLAGDTEPTDEHRTKAAEQVSELAQQAAAAGGLYVLGTERHESRRIDLQLRGRSGRQGDPGETRFVVSAEDEIPRLFGSDKLRRMLKTLLSSGDTDSALELPVLSRQFERAQEKVEEERARERKRVLEYDDVAEQQRQVVYELRAGFLHGRVDPPLVRRFEDVARAVAEDFLAQSPYAEDRELAELAARTRALFGVELETLPSDEELADALAGAVAEAYATRRAQWSDDVAEFVERRLALSCVDRHWRQLLADLDYLREGIGLRALAQQNPLFAYRNEAFELFEQTMADIWRDLAHMFFHARVQVGQRSADND